MRLVELVFLANCKNVDLDSFWSRFRGSFIIFKMWVIFAIKILSNDQCLRQTRKDEDAIIDVLQNRQLKPEDFIDPNQEDTMKRETCPQSEFIGTTTGISWFYDNETEEITWEFDDCLGG